MIIDIILALVYCVGAFLCWSLTPFLMSIFLVEDPIDQASFTAWMGMVGLLWPVALFMFVLWFACSRVWKMVKSLKVSEEIDRQ